MFITRRFDNNFYSSHFPERNLIHIFGMLWKWSIRWSDLWDMTWMVFSRRATPGIPWNVPHKPMVANRYGGSYHRLTLLTPPEGLCANALGCGCEPKGE